MLTRAVGGYNQPQNLAELLTVLDQFLGCHELPIAGLLNKFIESRGSVHPVFHGNNMIDQLSFTTRHTLLVQAVLEQRRECTVFVIAGQVVQLRYSPV